MAQSRLTILFQAPFWIGLYERVEYGTYEVCKITFGREPKDYEVHEYLLKHWRELQFSTGIPTEETVKRPSNPKRLQRQIRQTTAESVVGTKAQRALQMWREETKIQKRIRSRTQKEAAQKRQFALRQAKKKEKHRGH